MRQQPCVQVSSSFHQSCVCCILMHAMQCKATQWPHPNSHVGSRQRMEQARIQEETQVKADHSKRLKLMRQTLEEEKKKRMEHNARLQKQLELKQVGAVSAERSLHFKGGCSRVFCTCLKQQVNDCVYAQAFRLRPVQADTKGTEASSHQTCHIPVHGCCEKPSTRKLVWLVQNGPLGCFTTGQKQQNSNIEDADKTEFFAPCKRCCWAAEDDPGKASIPV